MRTFLYNVSNPLKITCCPLIAFKCARKLPKNNLKVHSKIAEQIQTMSYNKNILKAHKTIRHNTVTDHSLVALLMATREKKTLS